MPQRYVYAITEVNVDGCGSNATEYIYTDRPMTDQQISLLQNALEAAKANASENNSDTSDMITEAIAIPELADLNPEIGGLPYLTEIIF